MNIPTRGRLVALVGVFAVVATACSGSSTKSQARPAAKIAATTTLSSTTSTTDVQSKILTDLAAYNAMYRRLLENPDPIDPELPARITGGDLDVVRTYLAQLKEAHEFVRGPASDTYHVVSVQGTQAIVDECTRDDSHYYGPNGQVPDTPADHVTGHEVSLTLDAGTWKVSNVAKKASAC